jgi:molybdopterin converting factor small subunit
MSSNFKVPPGHFVVLYFASAGSFTAREHEFFEAPLPLSRLFQTLENQYNGMQTKVLESCLVTVNLEYVDVPQAGGEGMDQEYIIQAGDEVAIIPPVSSG